ncbi:MAG: GGDEF domain-containing protein, partial [Lysobacteraceae bacterium]
EEAYTRLSQLLDLLPRVSDEEARTQGLGVAAQLYSQGGQYDLAIKYADRLIAENQTDKGACIGGYERLVSLYKSGKLQEFGNEVEDTENACARIHEPVFAGLVRVNYAKFMIAQGKYNDAIVLLKAYEAESNNTHYKRLISAFDSILAQAYWKADDPQHAQLYANSALDNAIKNEFTEPLIDTYEVLYQVAQKQGDYEAAFALHEKYAAADKGYLNDTSTRALAYQMVKQQVQEKKQQIDTLSKKNQVLQLQQAVSAKSVVASRLWIALLITVLASIVLYAYRTKRAQLKFMNLARRDGLTGIFNRQHFIWEAERALEYTAKSVRDACVIVIDLDHFKQINDDHGHAAGDTVLKRTVAACLEQLREVDVFGRLGGEEFGIFMPDCVPERAVDVAEAMRKTIAGLCDLEEDAIAYPVYASFGISSARWSGYNLRQLLAHADSALYQAKREGRNRVAICDESTPLPAGLPPGVLDRRRG